jgi:hypothetical protein
MFWVEVDVMIMECLTAAGTLTMSRHLHMAAGAKGLNLVDACQDLWCDAGS